MIDSARRAFAVTVVLTAVFVASLFETGGFVQTNVPLDLVLLALNTMPLLALHLNPLAVTLTLSVAYPLWLIAGHEASLFQSLPALAALYAAGSWGRPLWLRAIALVSPVWMFMAAASGWWADTDLLEIGYVAVMFALAWALGVVVAVRRSYTLQLEDKTRALEKARQELAERAVADERARIARELHDVVAHAMSVITVRAGVGAHLAETRPAEAAEALGVIERTGREALSEMRRMLAVLRDPDPRAPRVEPQPGLDEVPRLVEQVREAGVVVAVTTEGSARPLPAGLDLAAYRVVQEALTNVVKHAPQARASVTIRHLPKTLEVEVYNAGHVTGPVAPGQGMRGMAERVALYGGRLDAGPSDGGFRVKARFPREPGEEVA
ncbi:MAG TPA: histidine kinase [Jiangellaceae bacterium]